MFEVSKGSDNRKDSPISVMFVVGRCRRREATAVDNPDEKQSR